MTELLPAFPALSPRDALTAQEALWRLLVRQARLYAPGSSSLPVETAAALAESILLTVGANRDPAVLLSPDLEARFQQGQRRLRQKVAVVRQLWQAVDDTRPPLENRSLSDTMNSLKRFPARYDWRFFAQEIPCDMDYQLAQMVPETLRGVDYVIEWLRRLGMENVFLDRFEPSFLRALLERSCPDYRGLLINLYEPAAVNALGLCLLGEDPRLLSVSPPQAERLQAMLSPLPPSALENALGESALRLSAALELTPSCGARYLRRTAMDLCPRLQAALVSDNLENIFLAF